MKLPKFSLSVCVLNETLQSYQISLSCLGWQDVPSCIGGSVLSPPMIGDWIFFLGAAAKLYGLRSFNSVGK